MTGRINGFATLMEQVALSGFVRIWCGTHQLDLLMHNFYASLLGEQFYHDLTGLIGFLHWQQTFEESIGSKCPKVATTRWLSIRNVTVWLRKHLVAVRQLLDEKNPRCKPLNVFWVMLFVVDDIAQESSIALKALQAMSLILSQQQSSIRQLRAFLMEYFKVKEEENRSREEQEEESRRADEQEEDLFADRQISEK